MTKDILKKLFVFASLLFLSNVCLKADGIDSLKSLLPKKSGQEKIKLLSEICWQYSSIDKDSGIVYGQKALALSKENDYKKGIGQALNDLGIVWFYQYEWDTAYDYFERSLAIRLLINDTSGIASAYNKMGIIKKLQGDYEHAIDYFILTLGFFEKMENKDLEMGMSYNNIAVCYADLNRYEEALEFYDKALALKTRKKDFSEMAGTLLNIANIHYEQKKYGLAEQEFHKAFGYISKSGKDTYLISAYNSIGVLKEAMGQYNEALQYFLKANAMIEKGNNNLYKASNYTKLGRINQFLGNFDVAEEYLFKALDLARKEKMSPNELDILQNLALMYESKKDFENAYHYEQLAGQLKDSINDQSNNEVIAEMQTKFQTEQKTKENKLLKADNKIKALHIEKQRNTNRLQLLVFFIALLLILGIGGFLFLNQKIKTQNKLAQQQKEWFKGLVEAENKERKRIASELHDGLGQLLSTAKLNVQCIEDTIKNAPEDEKKNYDISLALIDEACTEVRNISHNLMPGTLTKLGLVKALKDVAKVINQAGKTAVAFNYDENLPAMDEQIEIGIYRIAQEILNNILKHAHASKVEIALNHQNSRLNLMIRDNGIGLDKKKLEKSEGIGWKNIQSRINLLSGKLDFKSNKGKGTEFLISIPV
jgi:two-component system, NarL family, sensor kinase